MKDIKNLRTRQIIKLKLVPESLPFIRGDIEDRHKPYIEVIVQVVRVGKEELVVQKSGDHPTIRKHNGEIEQILHYSIRKDFIISYDIIRNTSFLIRDLIESKACGKQEIEGFLSFYDDTNHISK